MTTNPFRSALARRAAEKRAAIAHVSVIDVADVVRQMAVALAAGDRATADRPLPQSVWTIIKREAERVEAENQAALLKRREYAGATAATVDESKAAAPKGQPPEGAPQAATSEPNAPIRRRSWRFPTMPQDYWQVPGDGRGEGWLGR